MKKILVLLLMAINLSAFSQEDKSNFSVNTDFVSRYIFRGLDFGSSPAIQPGITYNLKNLEIGAWGSYAFLATETGIEADLYVSYTLPFGLSLGVTDYYFPGEKLILFNNVISPIRTGYYFEKNSHFLEANISQSIGNFSLVGNMFLSDNMDRDLYFECGYHFGVVDVFTGWGNKAYTKDGEWAFVNIGLTVTKEIKFSDSFSLPVYGSTIINPDAEQFHIVAGIRL